MDDLFVYPIFFYIILKLSFKQKFYNLMCIRVQLIIKKIYINFKYVKIFTTDEKIWDLLINVQNLIMNTVQQINVRSVSVERRYISSFSVNNDKVSCLAWVLTDVNEKECWGVEFLNNEHDCFSIPILKI